VVTDTSSHKLRNVFELVRLIKKYQFDAVIDFHPETMTAIAVFLSRIPHRFAPASRLVQMFYNRRLTQRCSYSQKPEFEYNTDLARFMIKHYVHGDTNTPAPPPYLVIAESQRMNTRNKYYESHNIDKNKKLVVIHPGSGGSAITIALEDYAQLISLLGSDHRLHFVITAGPGEEHIAHSLSEKIREFQNHVHVSDTGLRDFTEFLSIAYIFISGSTGVLHIAGALDVPTVAFYPEKQSATALRWRTLNSDNKYLAFTSEYSDNSTIAISVNDCYKKIQECYL
jgi:ADP-heptose:LPS heptosyltransferase